VLAMAMHRASASAIGHFNKMPFEKKTPAAKHAVLL
jgi:hypothetical protein